MATSISVAAASETRSVPCFMMLPQFEEQKRNDVTLRF